MHSLSGFLDMLILFGAIQGFIISLLLFLSNNNNKIANLLLAVLIFLLTLACLNIWLLNQSWYHTGLFQFINDVLPMVVIMPIGPLLYFYTRKTLDPEFIIGKNNRFHFYSTVIDLLPHIIVLCYTIGLLTGIVKNNPGPVANFIDDYNVYADIPRWLSLTLYAIFSFNYLAAKNASVKIRWLQQLHIAFFIFQSIWFFYLVPYVIPSLTDKMLNMLNWYPIYIPLSVLIYWLGIKGYLMQQHQQATAKASKILAELEPETIDQLSASLLTAMEEQQYYLNPDLTLNLFAQSIKVSPKIISVVLNQHLKVNFNDFVNTYRVEEFKRRYKQQHYSNFTIVGIAFECGFKSQPTFQRAFKQFTGCTPTDFDFSAA